MRAEASIENGLVFENENGGLDRIQGRPASRKDGPAGFKSAVATRIASVHGFIRNIPRAAMHNQGGFHREENGKANRVCPERGNLVVLIG